MPDLFDPNITDLITSEPLLPEQNLFTRMMERFVGVERLQDGNMIRATDIERSITPAPALYHLGGVNPYNLSGTLTRATGAYALSGSIDNIMVRADPVSWGTVGSISVDNVNNGFSRMLSNGIMTTRFNLSDEDTMMVGGNEYDNGDLYTGAQIKKLFKFMSTMMKEAESKVEVVDTTDSEVEEQ